MDFEIPDKRSNNPQDYDDDHRLGSMKKSWRIGIGRQTDGRQMISFDEGLTWGSIGQILGYLFGDVGEAEQERLYALMRNQFELTDRGAPLRQTNRE